MCGTFSHMWYSNDVVVNATLKFKCDALYATNKRQHNFPFLLYFIPFFFIYILHLCVIIFVSKTTLQAFVNCLWNTIYLLYSLSLRLREILCC